MRGCRSWCTKWMFVMLFIGLCSGCGITNGAGDLSGKNRNGNAVSSSAATGGAVSGKTISHIAEASVRSPYCNGTNYYESICDDEGGHKSIRQMSMDGRLIREIPLKINGWLAFVTEDELFYLDSNGGLEKAEVFRVPLKHTKDGDVVQIEKAKKLLTEKSNTAIHEFFANDNYLVYFTDNYELRVFDRSAGKFVAIRDIEDKKGPVADALFSMKDSMIGDTLFIGCKYSGLYSYTLGDRKPKCIDKTVHGAYAAIVCPQQNQVIYQHCKDCDGKNHGEIVWYCYRLDSGEIAPFKTGEQWKQLYESHGVWRTYQTQWSRQENAYDREATSKPEDAPLPCPFLFRDGNQLYSVDEAGIFSFDLNGDRTPHYEKAFSDFVSGKNYEVYDIVKIDQGVCYFEHQEEVEGEEETEEDEEEYDRYVYGYYDLAAKQYVQTKVVEE